MGCISPNNAPSSKPTKAKKLEKDEEPELKRYFQRLNQLNSNDDQESGSNQAQMPKPAKGSNDEKAKAPETELKAYKDPLEKLTIDECMKRHFEEINEEYIYEAYKQKPADGGEFKMELASIKAEEICACLLCGQQLGPKSLAKHYEADNHPVFKTGTGYTCLCCGHTFPKDGLTKKAKKRAETITMAALGI